AYTYLLTTRGTPQIYYGDEIGMFGSSDPDNRQDFPGGFPGDTHSAFTAPGRTEREQNIFSAVQQLLAIRKANAALRGGDIRILRDSDGVLAYLRTRDANQILIVINNTDTTGKVKVKLPASVTDG